VEERKTCIPLDDVTGLSVALEPGMFYTQATERSPRLGDDHETVGVFFFVSAAMFIFSPCQLAQSACR
jgi:hypothetical protein